MSELNKVKEAIKINELDIIQAKELQLLLLKLAYPVGKIDGLVGPKTFECWSDFKSDCYMKFPDIIGEGSVKLIKQKTIIPDYDLSTKESTIKSIAQECYRLRLKLPEHYSYVIATTEHETAGSFKPVREAYYISSDFTTAENFRKTNKTIKRYYPFYGRGYTQLTWEPNYEKYSLLTGLDLVKDPDKAMIPNISLFIMVHGFKSGAFTGAKLENYINDDKLDFYNARRCINGLDKANHIKTLTEKYLKEGINGK